jgi:thioredoxin reductase
MIDCDVAIIGAGPYGLSIAAHLKESGVNFRIFGHPMQTWRTHMPKGMRLKSEAFASSLYDPGSTFTLEVYCKENGIPYRHRGQPVPLEVFTAYGLDFQRRFVPELEEKLVTQLRRFPRGFRIQLEDGEILTARCAVVAVGLTHYAFLPPELAGLPEAFVTHSSKHSELAKFRGRDVAIVGAGASALDLAALLHQAGARVQVLTRQPTIRFHDPPGKRGPSLLDQLRNPLTGLGSGWQLFFYVNAPLLFRQLPLKLRLDRVKRVLGPAACWFVKEQVVGKVVLLTDFEISAARLANEKVDLQLIDGKGAVKTITVDHVIAATGYRVDLRRLGFLHEDLRATLKSVEHTPVLSSNFESSVPGLYFVGASAANTFGPLLRFAFGARFTSHRLAKHLAKSAAFATSTGKGAREEILEQDEVSVR